MKTLYYWVFLAALIFLCSDGASQLVRLPIKRKQSKKPNPNRKFVNFYSSIDIDNYMNTQFTASVKIGSNSQEFNLILDTGSSVLWVPDATYYGDGYTCSGSSTCQASYSTDLYLAYGEGEVEGYQAIDQVNIGGMTIPQYYMVVASFIADMPSGNFDGILGIGLGRYFETPNFPTIIEALKTNNLISTGTFSMYLGDDPSASGTSTGEIIFGGYDPKYAASDFQFLNLYSSSETLFWATNMSALGFNNVNISEVSNFPVIFDSGTSLIVLSDQMFQKFLDQAGTQGVYFSQSYETGTYTCDCSAQKSLGSLTLYFENATFNIPASAYILEQSGVCILGFDSQSGTVNLTNPVILGDVFLKNYYALYTADNSTIGLATAVPYSHFPVWLIIVIVIASVLLVVLGIYLWRRYRNKKKTAINQFGGGGVLIGGQ